MINKHDVKGRYQDKAEELAIERYDNDFYSLPDNKQLELYNEAMVIVTDALVTEAEALRDAKEGR